MHVEKRGTTMEVDLHGLNVEDARQRLEHLLSGLPENITEVRVIHGYNRGQALRDMVRRLNHPRVASHLPALNAGETRLILKTKGR